MKRKFILLVLMMALLLSAGLASAQITDVEIPDELPEGITVTYWHEWDGAQGEAINLIIDDFNANNAYGITVEQVYQGNTGGLQDQLTTGIVSGQLPNLTGAVFVTNAQGYYLDGILVPLDAYLEHPVWGFSAEEMADLNLDLIDINRVEGEPYNNQLLAWPIGVSANVLSVNLDMLAELGFDGPPTSFETFREVACAASEMTGPEGQDVQGFPIRISASDMYSFIVANGGSMFADGQYNFTNEGAIAALQFFQDLYNDGCAYIPDGPFVNTADFAFGLNPMAVGSSVGVPFIKGDIEASGSGIENWINTTVPYSDGNQALQVYMRSIGMLAAPPAEQLATWLFIKHFASTASQVTWTEYAQYQPYTFSGLEGLSDEFLAANPQFGSVREVLLGGEVHVWSEPALAVQGQVADVVEELIVNITTGRQDVAEAAAAAEEEANEILTEFMEDM
jgi:multiple sugar transport system substrate-binding protein